MKFGEPLTVIGIDQSAAGTAAVCLSIATGTLVSQLFWVPTKKDAEAFKQAGARLSPKVSAGDETLRVGRLVEQREALRTFIEDLQPHSVAAEDYGFARKAYAHTLGEVGGMIRTLCWDSGYALRFYDVQSVKIFATGKGNAEKAEIVQAIARDWNVNFAQYGKAPKYEDAAGNLADAFTIAQILRHEVLLRGGAIALDKLPDHRRRIFLRCTKQHPVNLLDAPMMARPA